MSYSIHQLSELSGVSVRTLHYYDEIGLLHPAFVRPNGYRTYERTEVIRLERILFFRELGFPLSEIRMMIDSPKYSVSEALRDQKKMLELKRTRLTTLIRIIKEKLKGGEHMDTKQIFGSLSRKQLDEYKEEARKKWGKAEAYKQSVNRTKHWTAEDYNRESRESKDISLALSKLMDKPVGNTEVQSAIARHHNYIEQFYDCSYDMYRSLGQMYVDDPRFASYYDGIRPGLAVFVRDAIGYYCDHAVRRKG